MLSTLSINREVIVDYRNNVLIKHGSARCPICGSGIFATMDEKLILKETDKYIQQNGELVKVKEQADLQTLYAAIKESGKSVADVISSLK